VRGRGGVACEPGSPAALAGERALWQTIPPAISRPVTSLWPPLLRRWWHGLADSAIERNQFLDRAALGKGEIQAGAAHILRR